jgi:uncharacterized protein YxjI
MMEYPLALSFKVSALAPQLAVTDANGRLLFYVKQELFKLKEEVTIFADAEQTQPLYKIGADRVLDFSARYRFADLDGSDLGSVRREGVKSLWRAHYDIFDGDAVVMTIREENPWAKMLDGLFSFIPIIGWFSGYVLHPTFLLSRPDGEVVMRLEKRPAFFEDQFTISRQAELNEEEEKRALLGLLMMVLLERTRG